MSEINLMVPSEETPTQGEIQHATALLEELDSDIAAMEYLMSVLQSNLSATREQREELHYAIETKSIVLCAPMSKIPPEVLGMIFEHCVQVTGYRSSGGLESGITPVKAPLLLTQVCRHWRDVAFTTPGLWTVIDIGRASFRSGVNLPEVIHFWLKHSAQLPLDIRLRDTNSIGDIARRRMEGKKYLGVLGSIQDELHRCRALKLDIKLVDHSISLPCLETLYIGSGGQLAAGVVINAPNLRWLDLSGCYSIRPEEVSSMLPMSRSIVSLRIQLKSHTSDPVLDFLAQFPRLTDLHCDVSCLRAPTISSYVILKYITDFSLKWDEHHLPLTSFLLALDLPSLLTLSLSVIALENISCLTHFAITSRRLRSLTLTRFDLTKCGSIFAYLAALEDLCIEECMGHISVYHLLAKPLDDGTWLCPRLRTLDDRDSMLDPTGCDSWKSTLVQACSDLIVARGLDETGDRELAHLAVYPLKKYTVKVEMCVYESIKAQLTALGICVNPSYF